MSRSAENNLAAALAYYQAMNDKNLEAVARHFHPEVEFVGPIAQLRGKPAVIEAARRFSSLARHVEVRAKFANDQQVMLAYDIDFPEPIGICHAAVLIDFKDGLINRLELFYDARPFAKM
jgi:hypothetical protein